MFEKYKFGDCLGQGSFGTVYAATRRIDHFPVAIKVTRKKDICRWTKLQDGRTVPREIVFLEKLGCVEGVVKLLYYYETKHSFHIVMEKHGPDLYDYVTERGPLPEHLARRIFGQVVRTIDRCHRLGVTHGDVKSDNIVLSGLDAKLVDFGLAEFLTPHLELSSGTPIYSPPEMFLRGSYRAVPGTVWSLGVVLYDMLTGMLPFETEKQVVEAKVRFEDPELSPQCRDLVRKCLGAEDRPTLEEILEHEWLEEEKENEVKNKINGPREE